MLNRERTIDCTSKKSVALLGKKVLVHFLKSSGLFYQKCHGLFYQKNITDFFTKQCHGLFYQQYWHGLFCSKLVFGSRPMKFFTFRVQFDYSGGSILTDWVLEEQNDGLWRLTRWPDFTCTFETYPIDTEVSGLGAKVQYFSDCFCSEPQYINGFSFVKDCIYRSTT